MDSGLEFSPEVGPEQRGGLVNINDSMATSEVNDVRIEELPGSTQV